MEEFDDIDNVQYASGSIEIESEPGGPNPSIEV
jgi:hypothetical protein